MTTKIKINGRMVECRKLSLDARIKPGDAVMSNVDPHEVLGTCDKEDGWHGIKTRVLGGLPAVYRPIKKKAKKVAGVKSVKAWAYIYDGKIHGVMMERESLRLHGVNDSMSIPVLITPLRKAK